MLTVRDSQMQEMADSSPNQQMILPCQKTWIEVRLVDKNNKPVPNEKYKIRLPDSTLKEGNLDQDGKVRFEGILPGQAMVCFPGIHGKDWQRIG